MKRRWILVGLVLSHVALALLIALIVVGRKTRARFRTCMNDPMCRIGIQLSGPPYPKNLTDATFARDLEKLSQSLPEPSITVFRLMKALGDSKRTDSRLSDAQKTCQSLGWSRCDREDLLEMRKMLFP